MNPTNFALIGGGWRAEFYLRIAQARPERFRVSGVLVRDAEKGQQIQQRWQVSVVQELPQLLAVRPDFALVSVPAAASPGILQELARQGVPALAETPPAPTLDALLELHHAVGRSGRVQVAEQYPFQPLHAARLALARSGRLGAVSQAQVSSAHGYHGMALLRALLGTGYDNARVRARRFVAPIVAGPGRDGPPLEETVRNADAQVIAQLDFGAKLGVYDFTGEQYFSWIRSPRVLVRGERGEINNSDVRYLTDFRTPVHLALARQDAGQDGNLEGFYHKGILAGAEWVYQNPFAQARLSDDEIAGATCLEKMAQFVGGGPSFYGLPEAAQDCYLSLTIERALATGEEVMTETQPWAQKT